MEEREQSLEATIGSGERELSLAQQTMELHKKKVIKQCHFHIPEVYPFVFRHLIVLRVPTS